MNKNEVDGLASHINKTIIMDDYRSLIPSDFVKKYWISDVSYISQKDWELIQFESALCKKHAIIGTVLQEYVELCGIVLNGLIELQRTYADVIGVTCNPGNNPILTENAAFFMTETLLKYSADNTFRENYLTKTAEFFITILRENELLSPKQLFSIFINFHAAHPQDHEAWTPLIQLLPIK